MHPAAGPPAYAGRGPARLRAPGLARCGPANIRTAYAVPARPCLRHHPGHGLTGAGGLCSLLDQAPPCLRRPQHGWLPLGSTPVCGFSDLVAAEELAIFAVDFSPWSARSRAPPVTLCGHEGRLRGRDPRGSPLDHADHALIRALLVQLGLALRCAEDSGSPGHGWVPLEFGMSDHPAGLSQYARALRDGKFYKSPKS